MMTAKVPGQSPNAEHLNAAFRAFNELSTQLAATYESLEARVGALTEELAATQDARHHELAEKERLANRLAHLLAVMPAGVVVLDGQGVIQEANPAAVALLGEPLIGLAWAALIERAFDPRPGDGHEVSLRSGRLVNVATQSLNPDPGQLMLLTDLTETRALQRQLARQERLGVMGEMVAGLAHQIRTPLTSALLYVSHLENPRVTDGVRLAGKIRERLRHLESLVNDMLIFARGEHPGAAPLTGAELVRVFVGATESLLRERGCTLSVDASAPEAEILANVDAVIGALTNLAENAIQACGPGGQLQLRVASAGGDWLEIQLTDNGPGVPAELQEKIFEPFFTTRAQGTGLGLAVVQSVVRAHHGELGLVSAPGAGATFSIRLPLIHAATAA